MEDALRALRHHFAYVPEPVRGSALRDAAARLRATVIRRIHCQGGTPTFCDQATIEALDHLDALPATGSWEDAIERLPVATRSELARALAFVRLMIARTATTRFADFFARVVTTPSGPRSIRDPTALDFATSQGLAECLQWKGLPLFKTVYDFSSYPMLLWHLRPATIFELGSGSGASAVWMRDLCEIFQIPCEVYSLDIKPPEVRRAGVHFMAGDCKRIQEILLPDMMQSAPHPWLVVEDAHVNTAGVFEHFHQYLRSGDYLVVEDSVNKLQTIAGFLTGREAQYRVDTRYTDLFGRNATCAGDSIFVRV